MNYNVPGQVLWVYAFDHTTGAPVTGDAANITAYVSIAGAALAPIADTSAAEVSSTNAPGWYQFGLAQAETNGEQLLFTAKSTTADVTVLGGVYATLPLNFVGFVTPDGADVGNVTGDVQGNVLGNVAGSVVSVVAPVTANVSKINSVVVTGTGTVADPWIGS